jgi:hypothetical protein
MELGNRHKRRDSCQRDTWDKNVPPGFLYVVQQSHVRFKLLNLSFMHGHQMTHAVFGGVNHANVSHSTLYVLFGSCF